MSSAGSIPVGGTMRVTIKDCERQTYKGSGPGGQHRNKTETGVRIIHHPSGARAECCETRSQHQNERIAFRRMAESPEFQRWAKADPIQVEQSIERIRTYNMVDRRVVDHRTGHRSSQIEAILDGDLDLLYR